MSSAEDSEKRRKLALRHPDDGQECSYLNSLDDIPLAQTLTCVSDVPTPAEVPEVSQPDEGKAPEPAFLSDVANPTEVPEVCQPDEGKAPDVANPAEVPEVSQPDKGNTQESIITIKDSQQTKNLSQPSSQSGFLARRLPPSGQV